MMEPFCRDVAAWLVQSGERVVAVHCKAGKGRTGFMICCYLLHCGFSPNAAHALRYYGIRRTYNLKGITIPSQIRYVYYYEQILAMRREGRPLPARNPLILTLMTIYGIPRNVRSTSVNVWFTVQTRDTKYSSKGKLNPERRLAQDFLFMQGNSSTGIVGIDDDVLVKFFHGTGLGRSAAMFHFWFNTRMIRMPSDQEQSPIKLVLRKFELDKAVKDKNHRLYSDSMRVELTFHSV